ncbi:cadmium-translocating P-type ATPase [Hylemonella gracilis]|uniref:Cadmium-translocating P-type ATPase n=1 Tax=Hylemonella gracilis TaxID=80880 RepID=A0A4P6UM48_9BURK|nr:cation-translocating P-type ATPase [Hylemonella gracilis]QBK06528.1 cadmium-translocating P-type ATPase [Hylemonella gracilis]
MTSALAAGASPAAALPVEAATGPASSALAQPTSTPVVDVGAEINAETAAQAPDVRALIDDPQFWPAFGQVVSGQDAASVPLWDSSLAIGGMYCAACALNVEDALRRLPGVESVSVSAGSQRARLRWREGVARPSQWLEAVQAAGYRAVPAQDQFASERRRQESRGALWRWLVSGFCMMQVMMYAWPAYVAGPGTAMGDLSGEQEQLLRWASWVLTLPVLLFCCGPFFSAAWRDLTSGLRQRRFSLRIGMDVPVALGMGITFIVSTLGTFEPQGIFGREVYFDSLTMFVCFLLTGRWLEQRLRNRTAGALDALMNRLPESVLRQKPEGVAGVPKYERVVLHRVRVGDVLRVLPGEAFPADGVLLDGLLPNSTQVDEALLTGESRPLKRGPGDAIIAGSHNLVAPVLMRVERVGKDTRYAQIVALMEQAEASRPRMAQLADRLARPFLFVVLLAATAAAAYWWQVDAATGQGGPGHALMVAVAVLIVTCPCALTLATPAALLAAAGTLARQGVLVRRLSALETLAGVDTFVFDKTGTLTSDALTLQAVRTREGWTRGQALAWGAALARQSLHPLSRALVKAATTVAWETMPVDEVREHSGLGLTGTVDGRTLRLGSPAHCSVPAQAVFGPHAMLADAQGWLATFEFGEEIRPDARATIAALREQGLAVRVLSGDAPAPVARVARELGLDPADARGACAPDDKLETLRQLQAQGRTVAVVGDGLNDGPALAGAQVSFAFGPSVPLARARADFVVLGEHLCSVAQAQAIARRTLRIVRQNIAWAVAYNAACIPLAVIGLLPAWAAGLGMAGSSLLVVLNALRLTRPVGLRATPGLEGA